MGTGSDGAGACLSGDAQYKSPRALRQTSKAALRIRGSVILFYLNQWLLMECLSRSTLGAYGLGS
ncbi:hypothetical protein JCM17845_13930 [Iodidimonas gelatinilytica]|uniref:Uncharacterized protein n=1 Tax=Iodidimonas gelatinilytica TaxID=1236966 RepID=A0A5A7N098_9PROT|nr:hypothetical protein JCM17845_13930 [Iodidimonas gelatinilytica]